MPVGVVQPHRVAGQVVRGQGHGVEDGVDLVGQDRVEQVFLAAVVGVHLRLAHLGVGRDAVDARPGEATARTLAGHGATVALVARRAHRLDRCRI
ncbi:hypothetical protein [Streptomyces sp. NPDC094472]|uniref:hypothetical protein n=1 Tax=unclassified Streptomyces TaxID=2593676 RepID=UPI0033326F9C